MHHLLVNLCIRLNFFPLSIGAKPEGDAAPMKLEDLEGHLNALKEMFIQKQKMMEELEKTAG